MTDHLLTGLSLLRLASAAIALVLVWQAYRAWQKTQDHRMRRLLIGFAVLAFSLLIEGASFQLVFPGDLLTAHLLEAGSQLAAMLVFLWALY